METCSESEQLELITVATSTSRSTEEFLKHETLCKTNRTNTDDDDDNDNVEESLNIENILKQITLLQDTWNKSPNTLTLQEEQVKEVEENNPQTKPFYEFPRSSSQLSSPKRKTDPESKKIQSLQEQLKEAQEKLKCVEVHNERLGENFKKVKTHRDQLLKENHRYGLKMSENEKVLDKLVKELDALRDEKNVEEKEHFHVTEELAKIKLDKKNLIVQSNKDKLTIQDLQRQCKEMETIFMKRHPDSVSALIVASKHPSIESDVKSLLENRISTLENELKEQDGDYKKQLSSVHDRVNGMKQNYETHIADLEKQIVNLQLLNSEIKNPRELKHVGLQTEHTTFSVGTQTYHPKPMLIKSTKSQNAGNVKDDGHLMATVRGLNVELAQKEKNFVKVSKELEVAKKQIARFSKINESPSKPVPEKPVLRRPFIRSNSAKSFKSPLDDKEKFKLKKEFADLQQDFENLKKKRIEDLYTLQSTHEKELMSLNVKVLPLQDDVDVLNTTVEMLRNQIKLMDEQLSVIMVERDNFKHKSELLGFKLNKYLECEVNNHTSRSRQSETDYGILKLKVAELEKRQEGRELRLRSLLESVTNIKDPHMDIELGKSSLIIQFVENQFVDSYDPTIENTFTKNVRLNSTDYEVKLVDTAGQDEYSIFPSQYSMDFHGYVLVYSITSSKSFQIVQIIYDKLLDIVGKVHVPIVLVGNKTDLHMERKISTEEGKRLAEKWKAGFAETSAKQNESVSEMFHTMLLEIEKADGNVQEKSGCILS